MELTNEIRWSYVLLGGMFTFLAQVGAWLQHNLQFKYPSLTPEWWGWYVLSIPLTWLFLKSTQLTVTGFGGSIWANRFMGFSIGIIVYAILTQLVFNQQITPKIWIQILLAFGIISTQIFMK